MAINVGGTGGRPYEVVMALDLRIPIGLLFAVLGALLAIFGLTSDPEMYRQSLGVNVNAWWGLVMLAFGVGMLGLAWRAARMRST